MRRRLLGDSVSLFATCLALPVGKCICVSGEDVRRAVTDESNLGRSPMPSEVDEYLRTIQANWEVRVTPNLFRDSYTIHKLRSIP